MRISKTVDTELPRILVHVAWQLRMRGATYNPEDAIQMGPALFSYPSPSVAFRGEDEVWQPTVEASPQQALVDRSRPKRHGS